MAGDAGVAERVTFEVAKADDYPTRRYDLICFFDSLHDMGWPVDALKHAASAVADDGTLMLIEPFAGDRVEDNFNPVGRLYYSASTTMCCAHAMSEDAQCRRDAVQFRHRGAPLMPPGPSADRRAYVRPFADDGGGEIAPLLAPSLVARRARALEDHLDVPDASTAAG